MTKRRKELKDMIVRNTLFKLNDICEGILKKECSDTTHNYEDLLIDKFKKPFLNELRGFVHVRTFLTGSINKDDPKKIPTKKGKLEGGS